MDDDLNVGNLLETRAERAPATLASGASLPGGRIGKRSISLAGFTVAAILVALAIAVISANSGRRVHVIERY
jgi:hypothetical protein